MSTDTETIPALAERIARLREQHQMVTDTPDCPHCEDGYCGGHEPVTFCENCQNEDNGPCDVLVVVEALESAPLAVADRIRTHADRYAPKGDPVKATMRRHLLIAVRVAAGPITREQLVEALRSPTVPALRSLAAVSETSSTEEEK